MRHFDRLNRVPLPGPTVEKWVSESAALIRKLCSPDEILLFGSAAESEVYDDSDLDFLIVFESAAEAKLAEKTLYRNTTLFPIPVDFVCIDKSLLEQKVKEGGFYMSILEESRPL